MYPTNVFYMIDKKCNEKCSKCDHWQSKSIKDVNSCDVATFVSRLPNVKELCIVGGEPLLYKNDILHIIEILPYIRIVIITNGVLADEAFLKSISHKNIHIVFSIDTIDKTFWEFVRGTKSYQKVMNNFYNALRILHKEQISVQSVLSKQTQDHIKNVEKMCKNYGIYHSIQDYIAEFNGKWDKVNIPQNIKADTSCKAYISNLSIFPNGDIYTCFQQNLIANCQKPIGNIFQTPQEILQNPYMQFVLNQMQKCSFSCKVLKCNQ